MASSMRFAMLTLVLIALFVLSDQFSTMSPAAAQEGTTSSDAVTSLTERPFQLPFAQPPGPDTWLMAQPYGSTTGAYRQRFTTYGASGGIHFGVDLSAPCGTEIVAVADGVVFAVDGPFGSPPHNLMIDHPQFGYASMYGHLLEAPKLIPGQQVKQGQVIALSGDSRETCNSRPHLHLEIRDLAYHFRKYNPTLLIEANWDNLSLIGSSGRDFARDLDEPRKWQSIYDQPEVQTGGPIVNDFANPWPPDWEKGVSWNTTAVKSVGLTAHVVSLTAAPATSAVAAGRQITTGNCCTNLAWSKDSRQVRFIDQPTIDMPLGIWGVNVTQSLPRTEFVSGWLGYTSPDETLVAYPDLRKEVTVIERLADGQTWEIDTQGRNINFTPDGQHITWTIFDEDAPSDTRTETFWVADTDGRNARVLYQAARTDVIAWLPDDKLLITRRIPRSTDQELFLVSLADGSETELGKFPRMRGQSLSPNRRYMVYYVTFEPETDKNGMWLLDLENPTQAPQELPFFGTYRWRDNERLIYVHFDPAATEHNFYEYDVAAGQSRMLFSGGTGLTIANNDWRVSPDGNKIALVAAKGTEFDGIWVLDIN